MTAIVTTLIIALLFVKAKTFDNIYADNGWRPMSNEKVFALQRNFIKTPTQIHDVGSALDNVYQGRRAIKIVKPEGIHLNGESIKGHEAIFSLKGIERNGRSFEDPDPTETTYEDIKTQKINIQMQPRKAKKISESDINLVTDHVDNPVESNDIPKVPNERRKQTENHKNNTYEVIEDLSQDNPLTEDDLKTQDSNGYKYEVPKAETKQHNDLTSKLVNILANYNIRSGDKLPNYALSLRQNSRNSNDEKFVYMKVPIKIPFRYNSPNHYPIDPLLAVFLSNYGHYLPGLYGFHRSYNNLYGYLASNNIHNNNPSGSYKLYSDTDSFH